MGDVDQLWRDRKLYSDVTIVCQEHEIPANRVLLATRSEVFRAMFAHSTLEASSGRIEITDVDAVVFEQLLAYIYTGFSPNVDALAEELLIAANKYALEELKTECARVLESHLSMDNVLEMLKLGDRHEASKLKEAAINFLVNPPTSSPTNPSRPIGTSSKKRIPNSPPKLSSCFSVTFVKAHHPHKIVFFSQERLLISHAYFLPLSDIIIYSYLRKWDFFTRFVICGRSTRVA